MPATGAIDSAVLSAINANPKTGKRGAAEELNTNFMTLLITQLKNQDPLKPMENTELTSQLAQINTVDGIDSLNKSLESINNQIGAGQQLQAAALIGRGVMVPGDRILVGADGVTTPFGIELAQSASHVGVAIVNQAGQMVRQFDVGAMAAGSETLVWDGLLDSGEVAPGGAYRVVVEALSGDGKPIPAASLNYALVNAISRDQAQSPILDLGGVSEPVRLSDVRQIL